MSRIFVLSLALVALAACKDQAPAPPPSLAGTWNGMVGDQTVVMTLVENAGVVNGSGTISHSTGPRALTIQGSFNRPNLSVTCTSGSAQPFNITAHMNQSGSQLVGTVNGSGFTGEPIVFNRQ